MTWLKIPGTRYDICDETMSVRHSDRPGKRLYPVGGVIRVYGDRGRTMQKYLPEYLLQCAESGETPTAEGRPLVKMSNTESTAPWSAMSRPWGSGTHRVRLVPHTPVQALRSGLEHQGITWSDPLMLGIDTWRFAS